MKIVIPKTLLAIGVFTLFSCKKDHKPTPPTNDKLYTLNFNMKSNLATNSVQSKLAVNAADTSLTNNVKKITYLLYDSQGKLKTFLNQDPTFSNFGTITDQAPNGTYYVYFVGNGGVDGESDFLHASVGRSSLDTYYAADTVVVNGANISSNLTMHRLNSLLELNIQDAIPNTISSITVTDAVPYGNLLLKDTTYLAFPNGQLVNQGTTSHTFTNAEKGTTNFKIRMNIFPAQVLHTITINVYATGFTQPIGNPIVIKNVKFIANAKTILSGTVFDKTTNNQNNFHISIEPGWNTTNINL
ncbi:Major fimbrial subunit protein (FimA) [Mucilaginibacter gossypiicola]|uniref:Major fimbrial subunit protein (FimA) n=1 Tax=Mucilaginibacter gossypiicola TaxID=551995 RepID=A0A1H8M7F4_9SPHI|nr:hypothetical protein [Mucilaginibacter gossypiicola]SEO13255.1 Major fimbrial subunit protein (FimA) [Mucilaginibacter gossypiicola]